MKETIEELKTVKEYFENMTDGSCPLCIIKAIEYLETMESENVLKKISEIAITFSKNIDSKIKLGDINFEV